MYNAILKLTLLFAVVFVAHGDNEKGRLCLLLSCFHKKYSWVFLTAKIFRYQCALIKIFNGGIFSVIKIIVIYRV